MKESVSIPLYVQEAAYDGNIGMMELAKFYMKATPAEKTALQTAIQKKDFKTAWKMVQDKTGIKLKGKEFATEGKVLKNLKRFVAGKTASQRASQEHDKAADAYDADDSATTKKHLKRAVKLNNLTQKEETVTEETTVYVPSSFKHAEDSIYSAIHKAHGSPNNHDMSVEFNKAGKREVHVNGKKNDKLTAALNSHLAGVKEEVAANSVSGGGVDMNPTGKPKWDKRSKFHVDHMFKRAHGGTKYKK